MRFPYILILLFSQIPLSSVLHVKAEKSDSKPELSVEDEIIFEEAASILNEKYSTYIDEVQADQYTGKDIVLDNISELVTDTSFISSRDGADVVKVERNEEATITIDAPETALYYIGFNYTTEKTNVLSTQLEMQVNNEFPFYELRNLTFESRWEGPEEIPKDKYGNEIIPQPVKVDEWQEKFVNDSSYRRSDPFFIELDKGKNEITLSVLEGSIFIDSVILSTEKELQDYEEGEVDGNELVIIEAEDATYRNDSAIRAGTLFDLNLTPYSSSKRKLNYLDADAYKKPGHTIEYDFEVEQSGFYYLGLNYRQDVKPDFPVFMNIKIDGEIPFQQFKNYPLDYASNFTHKTFTNPERDTDIPVYLEAGEHTVSFKISLDYLTTTIEKVEQLINEIQSLSLELTNLVGNNTDKYRDIRVEEFIPGITDQFIDWADRMNELYEDVKVFNPDVREIGAFSSLNIAEKQLRSLAKEVNKLIVRKDELSTGDNSITANLGNLLQEINDNGIGIDKFYFYQDEKDLPKEVGFFKKQFAKIERLFRSFSNQDYAVDNINPDHLQVWINRPRQYIEIIQRLIDEEFTAETGIKVDISIMPDENKLILSNAAGEAPDVAVGTNYALPFEIAIRGALKDLTEYEDFDEVFNRFPTGLHVPATVEGGIYALPDTMNFWVLFYREDIMDSLGLPIPDTLDQVKTYLPELQRKGMNFFFPTAGMPGLKTFAGTMPIIYQNDGRFYGDTIGRTALNEEEAIEGVRELTELFTIYNTPYDVPSFYQQFRDGSIPIGISDYFMYNLILNAAPEIANSWDIALMPGYENEDGEVERWSAGGAESNFIFEDSDKQDEAWEFLKWWSSTDVQVTFGNILQTTYGREYIWNPANIEAYEGLPWITSHKEVILEQTEWLVEVPRVPGSYMVEREISNAYNSIVLDGNNLRTAIDLASKRINRETFRKLEEFGYMKDGKMVKEYSNPEIDNE